LPYIRHPQVAEQLAGITGVETPVEEMHITLLYVGNVQEMTDQQVASVIFVTSLWARNFHPFTLKVNGIGRFNASDGSDGKDVLYARHRWP
jgi:2'-5' RNA ligase